MATETTLQHATFGFFVDQYYNVQETGSIIIPQNANYKSSAITSQIKDSLNEAVIDVYHYHADLISECNAERIAFFKDFLINEKVYEIKEVNKDDYVVIVGYEIFNKDGKMIKKAETGVKARFCNAVILSDVLENSSMEYRKGFVFDGRIELDIPEISRYGIRNAYVQHPYVLRITSIKVCGTIGVSPMLEESNTQVDYAKANHESHLHYEIHHDPMCHNTYSSHFITNAKVGTSIIDQLVVPAVLEIPGEYETVPMCEVDCTGLEYTIKLDHKLKNIVVNVEVFLDNYCTAYDVNDICEILKLNDPEYQVPEDPDTPIDPDIPVDPDTPIDPDDPGTTDPENPDDPGTTDPEDPGTTDPENPDSGETTDPENPDEGTTDPTDPENPDAGEGEGEGESGGETTDPTDPVDPVDPEDPGTEEGGGEEGGTTDPDIGDVTDPENPENPDAGGETTDPDTGETTDPENPGEGEGTTEEVTP